MSFLSLTREVHIFPSSPVRVKENCHKKHHSCGKAHWNTQKIHIKPEKLTIMRTVIQTLLHKDAIEKVHKITKPLHTIVEEGDVRGTAPYQRLDRI